jgi:outer membrane lipoprotein-sorting protein
MSAVRAGCFAGTLCLALAFAGCTPTRIALPSGAGAPFADFAAAYEDATRACAGIHTLTASMAVSGRAGQTKLRGRIDAGFAEPARARLEGLAPFGKPVFVLVADDDHATLVLPREDGVLDAPPASIIEALAGVAIDAASLRTAIAGCGFGAGPVTGGESFSNGWTGGSRGDARVYLAGGAGAWHLAAASRGDLTVFYSDVADGRPATVRLVASSARGAADLTLRLSDVDVNTPLDAAAFVAPLPAHPVAVSLDDLRRAGPLGAR